MKILNAIGIIASLVNVYGIEAMIATHPSSGRFQPGTKTQEFVKHALKRNRYTVGSPVQQAATVQAVSIQDRGLSSFLTDPHFLDKSGRRCTVLLADNLRRELESEKTDLQKQNQPKSMTKKLKKAVDTAALYDTSEDVESVSFELYGNEIGIADNAPI